MKDKNAFKTPIVIGVIFWLVVTFVVIWGATDEPKLNFSTNYQDYYPDPEGAEESHALIRELTEIQISPYIHSSIRSRESKVRQEAAATRNEGKGFDPYKIQDLSFEGKLEYLKEHSKEIRHNRDQLQEAERIITELEAFDLIGGAPSDFPFSSGFNYGNLRTYAKSLAWNSILDANNDSADQALLKLHNYADLAERAKPCARSLIEQLSWTAVSFICLSTAKDIVENYDVSEDTLREGIIKIQIRVEPLELLRRTFIQEKIFFSNTISLLPKTRIAGYPTLLENQTANQLSTHLDELYQLAESGKFSQIELEIKSFLDGNSGFQIKNWGGSQATINAYPNVIQFFSMFSKNERLILEYQELLRKKLKSKQLE
ncbi:hypothetical protein IEN85_01390 [Pelagicoccus sp. NFK12]|uniref:Uncharacterized protein n=1 Tax=Pelagicoccus enzymogenes TaxID=2773457 RepID=A0A927F4A9_9BACT|nr:hypothetical protein [Pelagicoccus enzymogenes]MBD5778148.1 hypothetical protein [Pelagicoccus enzymogenes]